MSGQQTPPPPHDIAHITACVRNGDVSASEMVTTVRAHRSHRRQQRPTRALVEGKEAHRNALIREQ